MRFISVAISLLFCCLSGYGAAAVHLPKLCSSPSRAASAFAGVNRHSATTTKPATESLLISDVRFVLELAVDTPSRNKGLMGRTSIDDDGGMLFIYPEPQVLSFWMANCLIDIDVVYINASGRVVSTHQMKAERPKSDRESQSQYESRLKRYSSRRSAQFAIELKVGTIERLNIQAGQSIDMDWPRLKKLAR